MDPLTIISLFLAILIIIETITIFSAPQKLFIHIIYDKSVQYHWILFTFVLTVLGISIYFVFSSMQIIEIASVVFMTVSAFTALILSFPKLLKPISKAIIENKPALAVNYIVWFAFALLIFYRVLS